MENYDWLYNEDFLTRLQSGQLTQEETQKLRNLKTENNQKKQFSEEELKELDEIVKRPYKTNKELLESFSDSYDISTFNQPIGNSKLEELIEGHKIDNEQRIGSNQEPFRYNILDLFDQLSPEDQNQLSQTNPQLIGEKIEYEQTKNVSQMQKNELDADYLEKLGTYNHGDFIDLLVEENKKKIENKFKNDYIKILDQELEGSNEGLSINPETNEIESTDKVKNKKLKQIKKEFNEQKEKELEQITKENIETTPGIHLEQLYANNQIIEENKSLLELIENETYVPKQSLKDAYESAMITTYSQLKRLPSSETNSEKAKEIKYKNLIIELYGRSTFEDSISELNKKSFENILKSIYTNLESDNEKLKYIISHIRQQPHDIEKLVQYEGNINLDEDTLSDSRIDFLEKQKINDLISGTFYKLDDLRNIIGVDDKNLISLLDEIENEDSEIKRASKIDFIYNKLFKTLDKEKKEKIKLKNKLSRYHLNGKSFEETLEEYNKDPKAFDEKFNIELQLALVDLKNRDDKYSIWDKVIWDFERELKNNGSTHLRKYHVEDTVKKGIRPERVDHRAENTFNILQLSDIHLYQESHFEVVGEYKDGSKKVNRTSREIRFDILDGLIEDIIKPAIKDGVNIDAIVFNGDFTEGKLLLDHLVKNTLDETFAIMGENYVNKELMSGDAKSLFNHYKKYIESEQIINSIYQHEFGFGKFNLKEHKQIMKSIEDAKEKNFQPSEYEKLYSQTFNEKLRVLFEKNNPKQPYRNVELAKIKQKFPEQTEGLYDALEIKINELEFHYNQIEKINENHEGLKERKLNLVDLIKFKQNSQQALIAKKLNEIAKKVFNEYQIESLLTLGNHDSTIVDQYLSHVVNLDKIPAHILKKNGKSLKIVGGGNFGINTSLPIDGNNHMAAPQQDSDKVDLLNERYPELFEKLETLEGQEKLMALFELHNLGASYSGFDPDRKRLEGVFSEHDKEGHFVHAIHNPATIGKKNKMKLLENFYDRPLSPWMSTAGHSSIEDDFTKNGGTITQLAGHIHTDHNELHYFNGEKVDIGTTTAPKPKIFGIDSESGAMESNIDLNYTDGLGNFVNRYQREKVPSVFFYNNFEEAYGLYKSAQSEKEKDEILNRFHMRDIHSIAWLEDYKKNGFNSKQEYKSHLESQLMTLEEIKTSTTPKSYEQIKDFTNGISTKRENLFAEIKQLQLDYSEYIKFDAKRKLDDLSEKPDEEYQLAA
ncbi:hypothetical protein HOK68_03980 [Candidatus Woesearchaeota archaeon]|nr:hypothetical protein [Candidatus Woesearchaeota archaeon]